MNRFTLVELRGFGFFFSQSRFDSAVHYLSETSGWGCAGTEVASPDIPAVCSVDCCCCPPVCPFWTAAA